MTIFEAVLLATVALGSTLLLFVGKRTLDPRDALHMQLIMGTSLALLLGFYESPTHMYRYWVALAAIPFFNFVCDWFFGKPVAPVHPTPFTGNVAQ